MMGLFIDALWDEPRIMHPLSLFQEVCGLPLVTWSGNERGGALQQHMCPIGGLRGRCFR